MGLLNKIERAEVGVPRAGCAAYQRSLPQRCHPGRAGLPVGQHPVGLGANAAAASVYRTRVCSWLCR